MNLSPIGARLFNVPLLIHPGKLDAIITGIGSRLTREDIEHTRADLNNDPIPAELFTSRRGEWTMQRDQGAFYAKHQGVAVLDVHGALAHRTQMTADSTAILGYQQIARNLDAALSDDSVHAILLDIDSPGGEVSGAFELAEQIRAANAVKPVYAIADGLAASAGYLIISGARQIAVTPTGYVGSIGVVMTHIDSSEAMRRAGLTVTHIYAGEHKVDGTPYQPLPEATRARFQGDINALYEQFVTAVATARGLDPALVRATEAATFRAEQAVDRRLANRVITTDALITELAAQRARSFPVGQPARATVSTGAPAMTDTHTAGAVTQPAITEADLDAARALGAEAERARIFAILDSEAASTRQQAALALARKPAIDAQTAADVLAALPTEVLVLDTAQAYTGNSQFEQHMQKLGNPAIGIDDDPNPSADARQLWGQIVARYQ